MPADNRVLYTKFLANMQWNGCAALYYQTLLTGYLFWLYQQLSPTLYGLVGTLFALLYLTVELLDLGYEGSLAGTLTDWQSTRSAFRRGVGYSAGWQLLILLGVASGLYFTRGACSSWFATNFQCANLATTVWALLASLIFIEGLQKQLRAIAQLLFFHRTLALAQTLQISLYLLLIGAGLSCRPLTPTLIFAPLLISTTLSCLIIGWQIYRYYRRLPSPAQLPLPPLFTATYYRNRAWIYLNQLSKLIYSGNFLVISLARLFGVTTVAPLKLAYRLASYLKYIWYHAIGLPVRTLLAQEQRLKLAPQRLWRSIFSGSFWWQTLGLSSVSLITVSIIAYYTNSWVGLSQLTSLLFLGLLLLENLFLLPEQYLLITRRLYWLALPNLATAGVLIGNYYLGPAAVCYPSYLSAAYQPQQLAYLLLSLILLRSTVLVGLKLALKKTVEKSSQ